MASSTVDAGVDGEQDHLAGVGVEAVAAEVGDDHRRARPCQPWAARRAAPPRLPGLVRKSIRSTNERADWRMRTNTSRALMAISQAPPDPGSRTLGWS